MKKNYMKPSMVAVKIEEKLLVNSDVIIFHDAGDGGDAVSKRHRGGSFTDFDFEEEEE